MIRTIFAVFTNPPTPVLNTSHSTTNIRLLPAHITRDDAIRYLHQPENILNLNANLVTATKLAATSVEHAEFYRGEAEQDRPGAGEDARATPIYNVVEREGGKTGKTEGGLYSGLAKRLVGDEVRYRMGLRATPDGLVMISHAMMGVWSRTTWTVRTAVESDEGFPGSGTGLVVQETGELRCNRMLMGFIKTTMEQSHEKLVDDFVQALAGRSNVTAS